MSTVGIATTIFVILALLAMVGVLLLSLPDLARYLRLRKMECTSSGCARPSSAPSSGAPGTGRWPACGSMSAASITSIPRRSCGRSPWPAAGGVAREAQAELVLRPVQARCGSCQAEDEAEDIPLACPSCEGGDELLLESIEYRS